MSMSLRVPAAALLVALAAPFVLSSPAHASSATTLRCPRSKPSADQVKTLLGKVDKATNAKVVAARGVKVTAVEPKASSTFTYDGRTQRALDVYQASGRKSVYFTQNRKVYQRIDRS